MTDNQKKVDAFRWLFGAVTVPFGAILGGLLSNSATMQNTAVAQGRDVWGMVQFGLACVAMFAFFAAVPAACEGVLHKRLPRPKLLLPVIALALFWCAYQIPFTMQSIQPGVWTAVMVAWLTCCAALVWLCSDVKRGVRR